MKALTCMTRLACLAALYAVLWLDAAHAQHKELRYSLYLPPRSVEGGIVPQFLEALGKRTDGRVTGRMFPGGQLFSGPATLKGIRDGGADMGFIVLPLTLGELKHANIGVDLQLHATDPFVAAGAVNETLMQSCAECKQDFATQNAIYLGGHAAPPWYVMCKAPAKSLADFRGRKLRVTGAWVARLANVLGMVPVQLPGTEIASALSGGQIDCAVSPVVWLKDLQLWDSAKYVFEQPLGPSAGLGLFVTNRKTYDSLEPRDQQILLDLAAQYSTRAIDAYLAHDATVRKEAAAKKVSFVRPGADFTKAVDDFRKNDLPNVVNDMTARGAQNAEAIVKAHLANLKTWEGIVAEVKGDREKYTQIMKERTMKGLLR
jgi:TRAP-type C4-dicarboxylate transport system substrate-binding protein